MSPKQKVPPHGGGIQFEFVGHIEPPKKHASTESDATLRVDAGLEDHPHLRFADEPALRVAARQKGWLPFVNHSNGEQGFWIPEVPDSVVYASWQRGLGYLPRADDWLRERGKNVPASLEQRLFNPLQDDEDDYEENERRRSEEEKQRRRRKAEEEEQAAEEAAQRRREEEEQKRQEEEERRRAEDEAQRRKNEEEERRRAQEEVERKRKEEEEKKKQEEQERRRAEEEARRRKHEEEERRRAEQEAERKRKEDEEKKREEEEERRNAEEEARRRRKEEEEEKKQRRNNGRDMSEDEIAEEMRRQQREAAERRDRERAEAEARAKQEKRELERKRFLRKDHGKQAFAYLAHEGAVDRQVWDRPDDDLKRLGYIDDKHVASGGTGKDGHVDAGEHVRSLEEAVHQRHPSLKGSILHEKHDECISQGWLEKRGPTDRMKWLPRWCVLSGALIKYYEDDGCTVLKGEISLQASSRAIPFTDSAAPGEAVKHQREKPFGFVIDIEPSAGKNRRLQYFDAKEEGELNAWIHSISQAASKHATSHLQFEPAPRVNVTQRLLSPLPRSPRPRSSSPRPHVERRRLGAPVDNQVNWSSKSPNPQRSRDAH